MNEIIFRCFSFDSKETKLSERSSRSPTNCIQNFLFWLFYLWNAQWEMQSKMDNLMTGH